MFAAFRQRQPGASFWHLLHWAAFAIALWLWMKSCYRLRCWGAQRVPRTGPVLLISNHQSFLDMPALGAGLLHRHFFTFARSTLYESRAYRWLLAAYNTVPLERGESDIKALRRGIELLKGGQALNIFAEGTRGDGGPVRPFKPGLMLMVKKANPVIVPVAIAGSSAAWPRGRKLPKPFGRVGVQFGEPIPAQQLMDMSTEAALQHLRQTIETMRCEITERLEGGATRGSASRR